MKQSIRWMVMAFVALGSSLALADAPLSDILRHAKDEGKLALIDVYAVWCVPCKMLEETVFVDPEVKQWMDRNVVFGRVDGDSDAGAPAMEKYKVGGYPTVLLLDADGKELGRTIGSIPAHQFVSTLEGYRTGQSREAVLQQALAANPLDVGSRMELVQILLEQKAFERAKPQLMLLLETDGAEAGEAAQMLLGIEDKEQPDRKTLAAIDLKMLTLLPKAQMGNASSAELTALVDMLSARGRSDEIVKLEEFLRNTSLDAAARYALSMNAARPHMQGERMPQALQVLQAGVAALEQAAPPESDRANRFYFKRYQLPELTGELFKVLLLMDRPDDAKAVAEHLLAMDASTDSYNGLAWAAVEAERCNDYVLSLARKGMELSAGRDPNMADTLAHVLQLMGKTDEALAVVDEALKGTHSPGRIKMLNETREGIGSKK